MKDLMICEKHGTSFREQATHYNALRWWILSALLYPGLSSNRVSHVCAKKGKRPNGRRGVQSPSRAAAMAQKKTRNVQK